METFNIFETSSTDNVKKPENNSAILNETGKGENSLAEEFFTAQKDFYRHYVGDSSVAIKLSSEAPQEVRRF